MNIIHTETWRYGDMKAALRLTEDGLIRIQIWGMVRRIDMDTMRRDAVLSMALPGAVAMLVDFRGASVLLGRDSPPLAIVPIPRALEPMPVAIVCSPADEPLFLAHAWRQAAAGLTRAVFTDPEPASSWLLARARGSSVWGRLA